MLAPLLLLSPSFQYTICLCDTRYKLTFTVYNTITISLIASDMHPVVRETLSYNAITSHPLVVSA